MPEALRIGLLGCGKQAGKHVSGLRATGRSIDIVTYDADPDAAKAFAERNSVSTADSEAAIFGDAGIDAVIVATPTPFHHDAILAALDAGKHVFCEKPLCTTRVEAERIRDASLAAGRFVQVGFIYRFVPTYMALHDALEASPPPLGPLVMALLRIGGRGSHAVWKHRKASRGGAINEMLVHGLDLAMWLFGPVADAKWHESLLLRPRRKIDGVEEAVDAEDFVLVTGTARSGPHVVIQADLVTPSFQQYLEVQGENGSFLGSIQPNFPSYFALTEARQGFAAGRTAIDYPQTNLFDRQMANLVDNIDRGAAVGCATVHESIRLIEILEQSRGN